MAKLLPIFLLTTLLISSCSRPLIEPVVTIDPLVPPPVSASPEVRCWLQENYAGILKDIPGMHIWLREQEVQERRLRAYYSIEPLTLPKPECKLPTEKLQTT